MDSRNIKWLVREFLRKTGVVPLLQIHKRILHNRRLSRWCHHEGDTLAVLVAGRSVVLRVRNEREYVTSLKLKDDEPLLSALAAYCRPGMAFWDVGASVGGYSAILLQTLGPSGSIIAFEPEPRSRERLIDNLALNDCKIATVLPWGLSDQCGKANIAISTNFESGTHSLLNDEHAGEWIEVELTTADALVTSGRARPNVVKLDVEGAELRVL